MANYIEQVNAEWHDLHVTNRRDGLQCQHSLFSLPMSTEIPSTFQERVLNAPDVCSNCFGIIREEHEIVPLKQRKRNRTYPTQKYTRYRRRTTVDHLPDVEPTHDHATFCECGTPGAFDRYRDEIVGAERFRELLKTAIRTIEKKGVSLSREHAVRRAFELGLATSSRFPICSADVAIAKGIGYGVTRATISAGSSNPNGQTAIVAD